MRTLFTFAGILITNIFLFGQTPASAPAGCGKNVSFAITAGGQPVAAIPGFVARTIGNQKRQERYPGLCFAQSPDPRAKNYVVVFSTQEESFKGLVPSVLKYINSAPISEGTPLSAIYGEMWHYASNQPEAASTTSLNLLHTDTSTALFVRAYNEQGTIISQISLKDISGWLHTKEKLLDRVLGDIRTDSRQLTASQAPLKTSLPVYYVNCDVPVKSLASEESTANSRPAPAAPPPQLAMLEFWSSPAGADVYVDGGFAGKTPASFTIAPGQYTITMRKLDFGTWERKLLVDAGKRRVGAYLAQKAMTLEFSPDSTPPAPASKDPVSESVLDIWSSPASADVFLDGGYVGKTPYSLVVPRGEHTVTLRKKDFGSWQRKVLVDAAKRRIGANLEQKVATLE
jgi:PEGA domain